MAFRQLEVEKPLGPIPPSRDLLGDPWNVNLGWNDLNNQRSFIQGLDFPNLSQVSDNAV